MKTKLCKVCGKEFTTKTDYDVKCCSSKCSHTRVYSDEQRKQKSDAMKKLILEGKAKAPKNDKDLSKWEKRKCLNCNKEYEGYIKYPSKYCSFKCSNKNPNLGGYREGSGRAKTGYYKGIYCGSTYELAWVIYRIDHNLPVERFRNELKSKVSKNQKSYFPDFILDSNMLVEIKGYENQEEVNRKSKIAEEHGYKVIVLRKNDLKQEFKWIEEKYNKKSHLETLYDDYRPKYEYFCLGCGIKFSRFYKAKNENVVYCSRGCNMKE